MRIDSISRYAICVMLLSLTACGKSNSANSGAESVAYSSTGNLSGNYTSAPAVNPGRIIVGLYPANVPVSCDLFNPDAIKSQTTEVIRWMAEIFPSGLTRHEHFTIVRDTGYDGEIGQGGHSTYMDAKAGRIEAFERLTTAFANQSMLPQFNTWRDHHSAARASGYQGVFLCGGHACWMAGQCDNLGRRL